MAFTYAGDLSTDLDKVRFYIQDTASGGGPKPSSGNFTDAELTGLVSTEGNWQRAVAAGLSILAAAWAKYADTELGPRRQALHQIADRYTAMANQWRQEHGVSGGGAGSRHPTRIDGYSDDISSEQV